LILDSPRVKLAGMLKRLATLAAVLTPKRRWTQFSLATMFVIVTALCMVLNFIVAPAAELQQSQPGRRFETERRFVCGFVSWD
jgi:hypothetical protein